MFLSIRIMQCMAIHYSQTMQNQMLIEVMQTRDKIDLCHYKDGIIVSKIVRIISLLFLIRH